MTNVPGQITSDFRLFVPFSKVDEEKREVWGWATVEVPDKQGEIIGFDASLEAFPEWVGNIREMHDPTKAVGKALQWIADTNKRGIYLGARISKGAQDTWEKILDGTLIGFSIGGKVLKREIKSWTDGNQYPWVTKYMLTETSTVDNPACPPALFDVVNKADGGVSPLPLDQLDIIEEVEGVKKSVKFGDLAKGAGAQLLKSVSMEDVRDVVYGALDNVGKWNAYVVATFPDAVVVSVRSDDGTDYYKIPYTTGKGDNDGDEDVILGEPVQVVMEWHEVVSDDAAELLEEAAKNAGLEKASITELLAKAGAKISAANREEIHKVRDAAFDMHKSMTKMDKAAGCAECTGIHDQFHKDDDVEDNQKGARVGDLHKAVGDYLGNSEALAKAVVPLISPLVAEELKKAIGQADSGLAVFVADKIAKAVTDGTAGLAKADELTKIAEEFAKRADGLEASLKAIEDSPAPGGPVLRGGGPVSKVFAGSPAGPEVTQEGIRAAIRELETAKAATSDPVQKDALGKTLATLTYKAQLMGIQV